MKRILLSLSFVMMFVMTSLGQTSEYQFRSAPKRLDWWIGGTLGSTLSFAENAASKNFSKNFPSIDVQGGAFFTRSLGARIVAGVSAQTGQAPDEFVQLNPAKYDTYYRFFLMSLNADAVLNLSTLFISPHKRRPRFEVMLFGGAGLIEAMHFDMKLKEWSEYPVDYQDKTCWTARAGLIGSMRLSPYWDWNIECSYNMTDNRYDGVEENTSPSGFMKFQTGFVYHLHNRSSRTFRLTTSLDSDWAPKYNIKDRDKKRKEELKRIEKARKESAKQRKAKSKEIKKHNEEVKKANERFKKEREKRAEAREEAKLYNEQIY